MELSASASREESREANAFPSIKCERSYYLLFGLSLAMNDGCMILNLMATVMAVD